MPSLQVNPIRKSPRNNLRDVVVTVENLDIKQLIVPIRKATKIRAQMENPSIKGNRVLKETTKEKDIRRQACLLVMQMTMLEMCTDL